MKILIIVFVVLAIISSLSSITYVTADVVVEQKNKKLEAERQKELAKQNKNQSKKNSKKGTAETDAEDEELPELVDHIDASRADKLLSNSLAMRMVSRERGTGRGKQEVVNIGDIDEVFEANEVVTIADLKAKGLISKGAGRVKILAGGQLNKPLTVKAENFSIQAIKMIELTGGKVVIMKND